MSYLISPQELISLGLNDIALLDCRSDLSDRENGFRKYQESHIPTALFAHLENDLSGPIILGETGRHPLPTIDAFAEKIRTWGLSTETPVVVYDQNNSMFAARAWWMLRWAGLTHVKVLNGGFDAWLAAGGETESGKPALPEPSRFSPEVNHSWTVSAEDLLNPSDQLALLDARALPRYLGETEPLDSKAGHIPSAWNADFSKNLGPSAAFRDKNDLANRFKPVKDSDVVCYCGSGVTACHNILAFAEAGLPQPKLYPGSWSEWITADERPIATILEGTPL